MNKLTENLMRLDKLARNSFSTKFVCPICKDIITDPDEIDFTMRIGMCVKCDDRNQDLKGDL